MLKRKFHDMIKSAKKSTLAEVTVEKENKIILECNQSLFANKVRITKIEWYPVK